MKKIILFIVVAVILTSCQQKPEYSEEFIMNTYITQQVYGKNAKTAVDRVNQRLVEIEKTLSLYIEDSEINMINRNSGVSPVKVSDLTYELLTIAKKYCDYSDGTFDITIAPLTKLWGITEENPKVPLDADIRKAVSLVDYNKILLDDTNKTVMLADVGMAIDLGGIAKGYICNEIVDLYKKNDIESALVSIGGNIVTFGKKPSNDDYTLGIRDPLGSANEIVGKLKVQNKIVSTTGGYERFFIQNNKTYHHILDTKTGYPVDSDLLSVTIVSDNGGLADYLSTTIFIAGKENIPHYINEKDYSIIVIDNKKNIYLSDALKDSFTITNAEYVLAKD